jgi:energy-coupling factor transporter ATP-binding protein EcfA2
MMTVSKLALQNFTAFEQVEFNFSPGINVFIGANSTGKTHVLKSLYTVLKVCEIGQRSSALDSNKLRGLLHDKFVGVFRPDRLGRLVRRAPGRKSALLELDYVQRAGLSQHIGVRITTQDRLAVIDDNQLPTPSSSVYVPSREFLSIYEGFSAAYEQRETAFDETYYDLSRALSLLPLRGPRLQDVKKLIEPLEGVIAGRVFQERGRFYVGMPEGKLEAHLVAEGYRKLASLMYLITNGSLIQQGILFWDEPEANLNPKLVTVVVRFLKRLAESGVQVFLATHDYLLSQELSMLAEYSSEAPLRFFSLFRLSEKDAVRLECADSLAEIEHNPILDEYAAYYDREVEHFQQQG